MMRSGALPILLLALALAACQDDCDDDNGSGNGGEEAATLPTSGAEPKFEPERWSIPDDLLRRAGEVWGDDVRRAEFLESENGRRYVRTALISFSNNCYNYACNSRTEPPVDGGRRTTFEPGRGGGYTPPSGWCKHFRDGSEVPAAADDPERRLCNADMTCDVLKAAVAADGLTETDCATACADGSYKKALMLDPLTDAERADATPDKEQTDYHFRRQDEGGRWSGKPGNAAATDRAPGGPDESGSGGPILDPREATARGPYTTFCACLCCSPAVRKAGFADPWTQPLFAPAAWLAAPALAQPPPAIQVIRRLHSGREDASWELDAVAAAELARRLEGLPEVALPARPILGDRGWVVFASDPAALASLPLPAPIVVSAGVIEAGGRAYADTRDVEAWLAQAAG